MSADSILDSLWVEKYRPKMLEDVVLPDSYKKYFKECIDKKTIPNLILYGRPGTGKTTLARILIDNIIGTSREDREMDLLELNGSVDNGVDIVRNLITSFTKVPPLNSSGLKIIYIDEADLMSNSMQAALRNVIENTKYCRYIFTLNLNHKIMDALFSRCQSFEFANTISKDYVKDRIKFLLDSEKIEYVDESVNNYINSYYPDIRKIIQRVQQNITNNLLSNKVLLTKQYEEDILDNIKTIPDYLRNNDTHSLMNTVKTIEKILNENEVDYTSIYLSLFNDPGISFTSKIIVSKYCNNHTQVLIPNMNFMAMIYEMIQNMCQKLKISCDI